MNHKLWILLLLGAGIMAQARSGEGEKIFEAELIKAVEKYKEFTKVNPLALWAPRMCRAPSLDEIADNSKSSDEATHGRKLYFLYASDSKAYLKPQPDHKQPAGQTLVKESFHPKKSDALIDHIGEPAGLFVMLKTDPATPGTDGGWVYGTLSVDGKKVTQSGRIASCMKCHAEAPHDRMFGLPEPAKKPADK